MDTPAVIYLVRHGECEGNADNRLRGRVDFPLNETGRLQAKAVAKALCCERLEYVYSSPLKRALETAELIAAPHEISVISREGFNNMRLGVWENRKKDELEKKFPEMWNLWLTNPESLNIEGAETVDNVQARAFAALNGIVNSH
ncbi:MAG: histidine phosphatase family protein, partial [Synergistaceae bacterium]|nr:histidine phosphatase family protein [Synergistaceae bacterium]